MPNKNITFNGVTLIKPGAYYGDNASAANQPGVPTTPPLIFLGYGYGPQPKTAQKFSNLNDLAGALRGGPAAAFIPFMATPSPELNGAQIVTFIDVSQNTQATFGLNVGATGGTVGINVTTTLYGLPSNLMQISVAVGSLGGNSRLLTLFDGYDNDIVTQDNLGLPLSIAYTGAQTGVTYSVTVVNGAATLLAVTSPLASESFTVPLGPAGYSTVAQVASYLNGTGHYVAQTPSNADLPSAQLVASAAVALPALGAPPATPTYVGVPAGLNDALWWLNNHTNGAVTATINGTPASTALTVIPNSHFSGAVSVPPVAADYAAGFTAAISQVGWVIFADSNLPAVQQLGAQHALLASNSAYGKFRRFFTGSSLGDSVATSIANAIACDAKECTYVTPGIARADPVSGIVTMYPGLYTAAACAAMATGNGANVPLTHKALTASGIEVPFTDTQIDQLQQAGVMPVAVVDNSGIPRVVSDFTTWQVDENPENVFNQQVAERHWLAYTMINVLAVYVGTTADPLDEMNILKAAKRGLNLLTYGAGNPTGVISSWDSSTLQLVYTGFNQQAAISVNVILVGQNRFITIYVPLQPLNFSLTVTA